MAANKRHYWPICAHFGGVASLVGSRRIFGEAVGVPILTTQGSSTWHPMTKHLERRLSSEQRIEHCARTREHVPSVTDDTLGCPTTWLGLSEPAGATPGGHPISQRKMSSLFREKCGSKFPSGQEASTSAQARHHHKDHFGGASELPRLTGKK